MRPIALPGARAGIQARQVRGSNKCRKRRIMITAIDRAAPAVTRSRRALSRPWRDIYAVSHSVSGHLYQFEIGGSPLAAGNALACLGSGGHNSFETVLEA